MFNAPSQRARESLAPVCPADTALLLAGCTDLHVEGSGTVTITSDRVALSTDVAYVCAAGSERCHDSGTHLYTYRPAAGENEWTVSPGFPVVDRLGHTVGLPPGTYTVQAKRSSFTEASNVVTVDVFSTSERDLTIWHQSHGRDGVSGRCLEGWQPSWAQWPNDGTGGFVCNRQIYAYYPDIPVTNGVLPVKE